MRQAHVIGTGDEAKFVIVFCAMGIKNDTADFFRRDFAESGALGRTVMSYLWYRKRSNSKP